MRKLLLTIALLLVIVPCIALSHAPEEAPQTRQEIIQLEGMDEEIETTYFESPRGYSLWIDTNYLVPQPADEGNDIDVFLRPGDEDGRFQVSIQYWSGLEYAFDLAVETARENLLANYGNADDVDTYGAFADLPACGLYARDDGNAIYQYIVDAGDGAYIITITCPREAAEGYGSRVIQMFRSFEKRAS